LIAVSMKFSKKQAAAFGLLKIAYLVISLVMMAIEAVIEFEKHGVP
jgi:hypothetical protein